MEEEKLKSIIKGYACNIISRFYASSSEGLGNAEIEFPVYLLQDINEQGKFLDSEANYKVLEKAQLPRNFNLFGLAKHFQDEGLLRKLEGCSVDEIKAVEIIGMRIRLDVKVHKI